MARFGAADFWPFPEVFSAAAVFITFSLAHPLAPFGTISWKPLQTQGKLCLQPSSGHPPSDSYLRESRLALKASPAALNCFLTSCCLRPSRWPGPFEGAGAWRRQHCRHPSGHRFLSVRKRGLRAWLGLEPPISGLFPRCFPQLRRAAFFVTFSLAPPLAPFGTISWKPLQTQGKLCLQPSSGHPPL